VKLVRKYWGKVLCFLGIHDGFLTKSEKIVAWEQALCTRCDWRGIVVPAYEQFTDRTDRRNMQKGRTEFVRKVKEEHDLL